VAKKGIPRSRFCARCDKRKAAPGWPTSAASMGSARRHTTSGRSDRICNQGAWVAHRAHNLRDFSKTPPVAL